MVQWLRLWASNVGDLGSIPGQGTKIPHALLHSQKVKKWNKTECGLRSPACLESGRRRLMAYVGSEAGNSAVLERAVRTDDVWGPRGDHMGSERTGLSLGSQRLSRQRPDVQALQEALWVSSGGPSVHSDGSHKGKGPQIKKKKILLSMFAT